MITCFERRSGVNYNRQTIAGKGIPIQTDTCAASFRGKYGRTALGFLCTLLRGAVRPISRLFSWCGIFGLVGLSVWVDGDQVEARVGVTETPLVEAPILGGALEQGSIPDLLADGSESSGPSEFGEPAELDEFEEFDALFPDDYESDTVQPTAPVGDEVGSARINLPATYEERTDPFVGFNRIMAGFNSGFRNRLVGSLVSTWREKVPYWVQELARSLVATANAPRVIINSVLQLDAASLARELGRLIINGTTTLLLFDVAYHLDLEQEPRRFNDTLTWWGFGHGPYIMVPVFGPGDVRTLISTPVDGLTNLFGLGAEFATIEVVAIKGIAGALIRFEKVAGSVQALEQTSLDYYVSLRTAYYRVRQHNESEVRRRREALFSRFSVLSFDKADPLACSNPDC